MKDENDRVADAGGYRIHRVDQTACRRPINQYRWYDGLCNEVVRRSDLQNLGTAYPTKRSPNAAEWDFQACSHLPQPVCHPSLASHHVPALRHTHLE